MAEFQHHQRSFFAGCTSTNIRISVNANVNALAAGNYLSTVTFSNATAGTVIDSINVQLTVGGLFFCDDFSTFTQNQILAGQNGWQNNGQGSVNEPFVTNNVVFLPAITGGFAADEPFKNIPMITNANTTASLNQSVFAAMVMTVTSAPPLSTASPARMVTFYQGQNPTTGQSTPFARDSMSVRDTGAGTYVLCARSSNSGANAYVFGTTPLNYGQQYRVILQGNVTNTDTYVYVNPASADLNSLTAEVHMHNTTTFQFDPNFGAFGICNTFLSGTPIIPGVAFAKICVTTNCTEAYNDTLSSGPLADPFATWQSQYFGGSGNPAAAGDADPDGDGMSNTNEFLAGFNPTNNAAYVHVISVVKTNTTDIKVTYLGANGNSTTVPPMASRTNVLEISLGGVGGSTGNNYSNNFTSAQTNILSGGTGLGGVSSFIDTNGAVGLTRYYRIRVLVP